MNNKPHTEATKKDVRKPKEKMGKYDSRREDKT